MNRLSLVLLPALASVVALTQTQSADISWRPKVGSVTKHRMTVFMGDVKIAQTIRSDVLKVESERIVVSEQKTRDRIQVGGFDYGSPFRVENQVRLMRPDGSTIGFTGYDPASPTAPQFEGLDILYPNKAIALGTTWIHNDGDSAASFTYIGDEELAGLKTHKIAFSLSSRAKHMTGTATGTYWLRPEDGLVVKALGRCRFETGREDRAFDGTFKIELVD